MAENSARVEVRKLRKKLRQIENLEKLERDLTPEEYTKVLMYIVFLLYIDRIELY